MPIGKSIIYAYTIYMKYLNYYLYIYYVVHFYALLFVDFDKYEKIILLLLLFILISLIDILTKEIPYSFNLILFLLSLFYLPSNYNLFNIIILLLVLIFCLLGLMGFGDFIFLISISIYLNHLFIYVLPLASIFVMMYIVLEKRISDAEIPFLPFLTLATFFLLLL